MFPQISAQMEERASQVVRKSAIDIEARAKAVVPVDTGALKASIQSEHNGLQSVVSVGQDYGIFVNYGTYKMAARPFFTSAIEVVTPAFHEAMRQLIQVSR